MNSRKTDGYAGLGAPDPSLAAKQQQNAEAWEEFRKLAKFRVNDRASVKGKVVTLNRITPVGGGLVRIQADYPEGCLDERLRPSEVSQAYSKRTAQEQGSRLLSNVMVQSAIQAAMDRRASKLGISAERVLDDLTGGPESDRNQTLWRLFCAAQMLKH